MSSLSNLYKQRYIVTMEENKRIINSNEMVEEKLQNLTREKKVKASGGFVEGLHPNIIDSIQDEKQEPSLEEMQEEAKRLLDEAREQAVEIINKAQAQAEDIKNEARDIGLQRGLADGREKAADELNQQKQKLLEKTKQLEEEYEQKTKELEPKLVDVICHVFEKVFHVQFDDKKEILLYLIQNAVMNIEGSREFQIRVCEQNYQFLEGHKSEIMERIGNSMSIEILSDPFIKGNQCVIETDSGVFECGLDVQLENLIKAIRSLCL